MLQISTMDFFQPNAAANEEILSSNGILKTVTQLIIDFGEIKNKDNPDLLQNHLEKIYKNLIWVNRISDELLAQYPLIPTLVEISTSNQPYIQKLCLSILVRLLDTSDIGIVQLSQLDYISFLNYFLPIDRITIFRKTAFIMRKMLMSDLTSEKMIEEGFIDNLINFSLTALSKHTLKANEYASTCLYILGALFNIISDEYLQNILPGIVALIDRLFECNYYEYRPFKKFLIPLCQRRPDFLLNETKILQYLLNYLATNMGHEKIVQFDTTCLHFLVEKPNSQVPPELFNNFSPDLFIRSIIQHNQNPKCVLCIYRFLNAIIPKLPISLIESFINDNILNCIVNAYPEMYMESKYNVMNFLWTLSKYCSQQNRIRLLDHSVFEMMCEILEIEDIRVQDTLTLISSFLDRIQSEVNVTEDSRLTKLFDLLEECRDSQYSSISREADFILRYFSTPQQSLD